MVEKEKKRTDIEVHEIVGRKSIGKWHWIEQEIDNDTVVLEEQK